MMKLPGKIYLISAALVRIYRPTESLPWDVFKSDCYKTIGHSTCSFLLAYLFIYHMYQTANRTTMVRGWNQVDFLTTVAVHKFWAEYN